MSEVPSDNKTFCVFPFFNLNTNTNGSVKLCCNIRQSIHVKDVDGREFNLGSDDINTVWTSKYMNDVRDRMLRGEEVRECRGCYEHERLTGDSSRTTTNRQYQDDADVNRRINRYKYNRTIHPLSSLEVRLGNTCNLSCNSCWGYSSSKSNEERISFLKKPVSNKTLHDAFTGELSLPRDLNKWFKTDTYQSNMVKSAKHLKRLYMTGGEPTLIKENARFLQHLIDSGNTECHVSFTTNGMTRDTHILSLLKHFPNCEIQVSCDAVGDAAYYVRYPTVWEEFKSNVEAIAEIPNVRLVFYTVVSAYNLFTLPDILEYVESIAVRRQAWWTPIFLDYAEYLHAHIWPLEARQRAATEFRESMSRFPVLSKHMDHVVDRVCAFYTSPDEHTDRIKTFVDYNDVLDTNRGTSFNDTFPRLVPLLPPRTT